MVDSSCSNMSSNRVMTSVLQTSMQGRRGTEGESNEGGRGNGGVGRARGEGRASGRIGTLFGHLYNNSRTDLDTVWVEDSGGPTEPCIKWGSGGAEGRCHGNQFSGANCYSGLSGL